MDEVCGNCKRWWRHLKRGSGKGLSVYGTCFLDGTRQGGNNTCGYHSNKYPVRQEELLPPKTLNIKERRKVRQSFRFKINTVEWF